MQVYKYEIDCMSGEPWRYVYHEEDTHDPMTVIKNIKVPML